MTMYYQYVIFDSVAKLYYDHTRSNWCKEPRTMFTKLPNAEKRLENFRRNGSNNLAIHWIALLDNCNGGYRNE